MSRSPTRRLRILCFLCGALGAVTVIAAYYPGFMSPDSIAQLRQGREGIFDDTHPPVMAALWGLLDRLWPGPLPMVCLQNLLFWGGLSTLALSWFSANWAWAIVLGIGFSPAVFALLGTVWKDVQMGSALLMAFALIVRLKNARGLRRSALIAGALLALFYAALMRHNGILAVLPLLLLLVDAIQPLRRHLKEGLGLFVGLLVAVSISVLFINRSLASHHSHEWQQSMAFDLTAISIAEKQDLFPSSFWDGRPPISVERMAQIYNPAAAWVLTVPRSPGPHFEWLNGSDATTPPALGDLTVAWLKAITRHPLEFLENRTRFSARLLGITYDDLCGPFCQGVYWNDLGVKLGDSPLNRLTLSLLNALRHSFVFYGWIFVTILVAAFIGEVRRGVAAAPATVALAASGLLNALPHLVIGVACDFRFLWWSVISAMILLAAWREWLPGLKRSAPTAAGVGGGADGPKEDAGSVAYASTGGEP